MFEKKRGTRFLASVMALVMLLSLAPVGALAVDDEAQNQDVVALPADGDNPKPVVTDEENTANTNEEPTPPPANEGIATLPANNNNAPVALPETPVIVKPAEGLIDEACGVDADTSDNGIADYKGGGPGGGNQGKPVEQPEAVTSITAEYWVTNARVTADSETSKNISSNNSEIVGAGENGVAVKTLAPETGTQGNNNVIFWQARVLSDEDKQTDGGGVDSTSKGKEIQSIRYYNSEFSYQEKGNAQWTEFTITNGKVQEQLVFYYMIKADFEQNVSVAITDWPNTSDSQIPQGAPSPHQVNYEVWKLADAGADLNNAEQLGETVPTYYNSALTISAIKVSMNDNQQYYIRNIVIDSTKGQYDNPAVTDSEAEFSLNLKTAGEDRNLSRNGVITIKIYVTAYKYELAYQTNEGRINDSSYSRAGYYLPKDPITAPTNVTKTGYTFAGWYTDNACTDNNKWTDSTMPRQKLTLYAKWNENNYTVNYNLNYTDATNSLEDKTDVKWGDNNLLPGDNPSREGFLFDAWYTQPTGGDKVDSSTAYSEVAANDTDPSVTLYAHWTEDPTARPTTTDVYVYFKTQNTKGQPVNISGTTIKYNGHGWATLGRINTTQTLTSGTQYTGTNSTLVAVGNDAKTKLTGNALWNGNASIAPTVLPHIQWTKLAQHNGADDYVKAGTTWHLDGQITGYKVTYAAGAGEDTVNEIPDPSETYYLSGSDYTVSDATPTRTGYVFTGWKSNIEKDATVYKASEKLKMPAQDVVLTAQWEVDNWKDGDSKTPTDKDSETGGDGIPDCYQVLVNYKSGDLDKGKIADTARTQEVLTIKNTAGEWASTGTVKASGSTATATGSRCYFVNWTKKQEGTTDVSTVAPTANLPAQNIENAKGGDVYTFTANFDRSSGGGSGGSNRPKPPVVEIPDDVPTGLNGKDHYAYIIGYGNNDVRPQNNITRAEVATIFFRLLTDETREANMTKSNSYNDVKDGDWFCCAVSTLSKMGIIKGYEDGSFKPNDPISRAEFAAIAARFDPDGDKPPASFADVTSHWAKDEISIAANHGWIKGYEDGSFKPDQKITRAETMTLVNRVLNRLPEAKDDLHKDMKTWVDNMDETAWYYLAVQEATNSHYFKNKTSTKFEQWTDLRDTRDWSELEK